MIPDVPPQENDRSLQGYRIGRTVLTGYRGRLRVVVRGRTAPRSRTPLLRPTTVTMMLTILWSPHNFLRRRTPLLVTFCFPEQQRASAHAELTRHVMAAALDGWQQPGRM